VILSAGNTWLNTGEIVGIFDLDITSQSYITRDFLKRADRNGQVVNAAEDIPKSFTLCTDGTEHRVVLTPYATSVLRTRAERKKFR